MNVERLIGDLRSLRAACRAHNRMPTGAEVCQSAIDALAKLQAERDEAIAALEVCRESLVDQAAARADPAMPLLVASVRERLEGESEAVYAMSESREDRIYAHGLSLLCDWQKAAASRALGGGG